MPFLTKPEEKIPIRKSLRAKGSPEGRAAGSDEKASLFSPERHGCVLMKTGLQIQAGSGMQTAF